MTKAKSKRSTEGSSSDVICGPAPLSAAVLNRHVVCVSVPTQGCGFRAAPTSAARSPEKQKINDDEGYDYTTDAGGEHVANIVSGHALARFDGSFNDLFVVPFRHQGVFAEIDTAPIQCLSLTLNKSAWPVDL